MTYLKDVNRDIYIFKAPTYFDFKRGLKLFLFLSFFKTRQIELGLTYE